MVNYILQRILHQNLRISVSLHYTPGDAGTSTNLKDKFGNEVAESPDSEMHWVRLPHQHHKHNIVHNNFIYNY